MTNLIIERLEVASGAHLICGPPDDGERIESRSCSRFPERRVDGDVALVRAKHEIGSERAVDGAEDLVSDFLDVFRASFREVLLIRGRVGVALVDENRVEVRGETCDVEGHGGPVDVENQSSRQ